jgi:uncharacterized protein (TIGR03437 family)
VFSAGGDGRGVAAAYAVRVDAAGGQTILPVFACAGSCYPVALNLGWGNVYLILYATGIRWTPDVAVTLGGQPAPLYYAGPQGQYPGLDQVNVLVPASLAGAGVVEVRLTAGSRAANVVSVEVR